MAPVFNRADNERRRPLGRHSSAREAGRGREPARSRTSGAANPNIPPGHDYEYDEAHDVPAGRWVKLLRHIVSIRQW